MAARWAKHFQPRPDASSRVFFFPHAGAGASAVQRWGMRLPADIEFRPIEYPGRWTRSSEPLPSSVSALADEITSALYSVLDRPFVVIGYSFGALVAFEWLRRLARSNDVEPLAFLPCALAAPHLPLRGAPINALPEPELLREMAERYGDTSVAQLADREIRAMALPVVRADIAARESYVYHAGPPLRCPIHAFGGDADPSVSPQELDAWHVHTRAHFSARRFPGNHFFISEPGNADAMRAYLLRIISARVTGEGNLPAV